MGGDLGGTKGRSPKSLRWGTVYVSVPQYLGNTPYKLLIFGKHWGKVSVKKFSRNFGLKRKFVLKKSRSEIWPEKSDDTVRECFLVPHPKLRAKSQPMERSYLL